MPEENVVRATSRCPLCAEVQWEELQSIDTTQIKEHDMETLANLCTMGVFI